MSEKPRQLRIFLCHASADKPAVRKLYRYLHSKGMDPWLDEEKLLPGQIWEKEIQKASYASDAFIVCLSKNSITKEGFVQREIKFALDKALEMPEETIFLIPARLDDCKPPESLRTYQWVDLFQENWGRRLISSLNERIKQLGLNLIETSDMESQLPLKAIENYQVVNNIPIGIASNKDFHRSLKLQWTASELILIGAQRLAIYLELYYPNYLNQLYLLDLTKRGDGLRLFHTVLPKTITNPAGFSEGTISYIIRHTQLLPRHFLLSLNAIFKREEGTQTLPPFPISENKIINSIYQTKKRIVNEIFVAFKSIHPSAEEVCKRCIPELESKFSVNELDKVYIQCGKAVFDGDNLFDFQRMLLEIGAIGRVIPSKATEIYIQGDFEYSVSHEIVVSHDDELCIHPLFSGIFGGDRQERPVYPYGTNIEDEDFWENFE